MADRSRKRPGSVTLSEMGMDMEKKLPGEVFTDVGRGESDLIPGGHVDELRREFSIWSLGSMCLCLMGTWEALTGVVGAALTNGGAPCLFYNYIISFIGTIAIACSLAEIASIYPTAGGQYHWVAALAPKKQMIVASWFTGWISIGGQIVLTASAAFAAGLQFQSLVGVHNEGYAPMRWQGMLFYWMVLLYSAAVNIWGSKMLPHTNLASGVLHIVGFVAIVTVLSVMAPKHNASFVFIEVTNSSGWSSNGISWFVGLLSTVYPFLGYDAACHLAEEMPNPSRNVPIAMVGSVLVNGLMGLGYSIILLFSLGDLQELLTSPTGFPFMQLFLNVTQNKIGATFLILIISLIAVAANSAGLTSTSRTFWAFARDSATPFPEYFAHVDKSLQIPVRAVALVTVAQMILGMIYLVNTTAFNAILSMSILGMYCSYLLPIVYMQLHGRKMLQSTGLSGPFKLSGILGPMINVIAIFWILLAMVFSTFPSVQPVTVANMNYASAVMGAWVFAGVAFFFTSGKGRYSGPIIK